MSKKENNEAPLTKVRIDEGSLKKGGYNPKPTTPRPTPPKGQGGKTTPKK